MMCTDLLHLYMTSRDIGILLRSQVRRFNQSHTRLERQFESEKDP